MGGQTFWSEFHIIPGVLPQETSFAEQIMRLECMALIQTERVKVEVNPAALHMKWIQINHHDNYAREVVGGLAVANQSGIIRIMEMQVAVALQGGSLFA